MGKLHDKLKAIGYEGHELEVYLVRLLFCLFADDTSIFERRQFQDLIEQRTAEDGQDLRNGWRTCLRFSIRPQDKRLKSARRTTCRLPLCQRQPVRRASAHRRF